MIDESPQMVQNYQFLNLNLFTMTFSLKATIFASSALAIFLNLTQFASSYAQQAKASFSPAWAMSAPKSPAQTVPAASLPPINEATGPSTSQSLSVISTAAPSTVQSKLAAAGLNASYANKYSSVQARTGTPWQILAAVHSVETGQSGNTARRSYAGAVGPMQFMPATFAHYAADGDGNGTTDITNLDDALLTAGRYLAAGGADKGHYSSALFNYNHSNTYVAKVLGIAHRLGL